MPYTPIGSIGFDDLDSQLDPTWHIDEVLVTSGVGVLSGDGGHGKSWLAQSLAICTAAGRKWLDHFPVRHGPVVIIDEENSLPLLKQRKQLLMIGMGLNNADLLPIRIINHKGIDFFPQKHKNGTITHRDIFWQYLAEIQLWQPSLLIVDSLRAAHTGQEDRSDDIRPVMNAIRDMLKLAGIDTSALVCHHVNKSGNFRGSIDIKQAANVLIEVDKKPVKGCNTESIINLSCSKLRDAQEFEPFKVKMTSSKSEVKLIYDGKQSKTMELSTWLQTILPVGNGGMAREELIELAEIDGICKQRKLDEELKWREADGCIIGFMKGRDKFYRITSQYVPWPDFKPNGKGVTV